MINYGTNVNPPLNRNSVGTREKEKRKKRKAHDLPEPDTPMITIATPVFLQ